MLKSEMQHQYWVTKKTVQRKLGSKEDECIVSSDAELDSKIELFKSINDNCVHLYRVIDNYQERICVLAHEENAVGKFLNTGGKGSATSGKVMSISGKSMSYCGQQRQSLLRAPLLRLLQEVETFRGRAVMDTHITIQTMERERTEYRAALSWMKSASAQLDPDTGRGLDKFRKAQQHVRASKTKFDRYTLDCLQKIDLLAAARCNMYSHALVAYQQALVEFFSKTLETFKTTITALDKGQQYNFTILKELTQNPSSEPETALPIDSKADSDQMLFFKDDYKDENQSDSKDENNKKETTFVSQLVDVSANNDSGTQILKDVRNIECDTSNLDSSFDLLGLSTDTNDLSDLTSSSFAYMPSQLLLSDIADFTSFDNDAAASRTSTAVAATKPDNNPILDLFNKIPPVAKQKHQTESKSMNLKQNKEKLSRKDKSAWFGLFADLDPLANAQSVENKMSENSNNEAA